MGLSYKQQVVLPILEKHLNPQYVKFALEDSDLVEEIYSASVKVSDKFALEVALNTLFHYFLCVLDRERAEL